MMPKNFADRLLDTLDEVKNPSCVGLDPRIQMMPAAVKRKAMERHRVREREGVDRIAVLFEATADTIFDFNKAIIDATWDIVAAYKPNIAFYECYGPSGVRAFLRTIDYIRSKGRIAIADCKREDIGDTSKSYADGFLGTVELVDGSLTSVFNADALTVSPYVGSDNVSQFVRACSDNGKGIFVLDKTSNPSSGELQDLRFDQQFGGRTLYEQMALLIDQWGSKVRGTRGYSSVGAVVGANFPEQATRIREMMESAIILVPAYGAQGGAARDTLPSINADGYGAIVNNARNLIFACEREPYRTQFTEGENPYGQGDKLSYFALAAREAAIAMREDLVSAMRAARKLPTGW